MLQACDAYDLVRKRLDALMPGTDPIPDEHPRAAAYSAAWSAGSPLLSRLVDLQPRTRLGHAMRATAFLVYDEGDVLRRARRVRRVEDRLLASILVDLADCG